MIRVRNNFNTRQVSNRVRAAIGVYADTAAKQMEREAKQNANWDDRTTNARNSIQGNFNWQGDNAIITLSGNMDYSVFLELAHEKRFAILKPTIERNAPVVISAYQRLVR